MKVLLAGSLVVLCFLILLPALGSFDRNGEDKHKKVWSGRSFADRTVVEKTSRISAVAPGFRSERVWSGQDDWEPAIAADSGSRYVYQLTTRFSGPAPCANCPLPTIIFRSSINGGATWNRDRFLLITGKRQADPQIEVDKKGRLYAAFLDGGGLTFTSSSNRGVTWTPGISFAGPGKQPSYADKPILAVSANGQHVYIGFNAGDGYVVASHNGGRTFSPPVRTSRSTRTWFHTGGAVAADGTVYFSTTDFASGYQGDSRIQMLKSRNGSAWTVTLVDTCREVAPCSDVPGCYFGFLGPSAAMAIDVTGRIMILYHANTVPGTPQSMFIRTSFDGIRWSPRKRISVPSPATHNAFPALAAGPGQGDFRAAWQANRNGNLQVWNTWFRQTKNAGTTWGPLRRLSDRGSGAPYKQLPGFKFPYGDYFELAVDGVGGNHLIWGEGDSYLGPGGSWYTSGK